MKKLDDIFSIDSNCAIQEPQIIEGEVIEHRDIKEDDHKDIDYEYARNNLYGLIQNGQNAVDGILQVARESNSPRAFEVAATLIKTISDTNDRLMQLHKLKKELRNKSEENNVESKLQVQNAVFVGSTAELLKLAKKDK
jgi:hypothetical protein